MDLEEQRLAGDRSAELRAMAERLKWSRARIEAYQRRALRSLLATARAGSRWHARRLEGIDPESFDIADLASLPPMTKADIREHFEEIVTDPRLRLDRCRRFLRQEHDEYLEGEYKVSSTGGSSGDPTLVVHSRREMVCGPLSFLRFLERWARRTSAWEGLPVIAALTSIAPRYRSMHGYRYIPARETHLVDVAAPIVEIVAELNRVRPTLITVYPSILPRLAHEAEAGRLTIRPKVVAVGAETFLPEHQDAVTRAWGCPVIDGWGSSEVGALGCGSGFDSGLVQFEDLAIVELVDRFERPVGAGELCAKIYVTPLYRTTMPLLRYELRDQLAWVDEPASCGTAFRRLTHVYGRTDDRFVFPGGVEVHPRELCAAFAGEPGVLEYQIRQTRGGVHLRLTTVAPPSLERIEAAIGRALERAGLSDPRIDLERVSTIERTGPAAKLQRFIPLSPAV